MQGSPKVGCKKIEDITTGGPRPAVVAAIQYKPKLASFVIWHHVRLLPLADAAAQNSQCDAQATAYGPEDTEAYDERLVLRKPCQVLAKNAISLEGGLCDGNPLFNEIGSHRAFRHVHVKCGMAQAKLRVIVLDFHCAVVDFHLSCLYAIPCITPSFLEDRATYGARLILCEGCHIKLWQRHLFASGIGLMSAVPTEVFACIGRGCGDKEACDGDGAHHDGEMSKA